jgi:adenylate kinase family enzyme
VRPGAHDPVESIVSAGDYGWLVSAEGERSVRRVAVMGTPGAGKSTLATELGRSLGAPVFHLDAIYWKPGWVASSRDEFVERQRALVERDIRVIDGNYSHCGLSERIERADAVIVLTVRRWIATRRIIGRWLRYRGTTRPDLGEDRPERLDLEFLRWTWNWERNHPNFVRDLREQAAGKPVIVIHNRSEAERVINGVDFSPR